MFGYDLRIMLLYIFFRPSWIYPLYDFFLIIESKICMHKYSITHYFTLHTNFFVWINSKVYQFFSQLEADVTCDRTLIAICCSSETWAPNAIHNVCVLGFPWKLQSSLGEQITIVLHDLWHDVAQLSLVTACYHGIFSLSWHDNTWWLFILVL